MISTELKCLNSILKRPYKGNEKTIIWEKIFVTLVTDKGLLSITYI